MIKGPELKRENSNAANTLKYMAKEVSPQNAIKCPCDYGICDECQCNGEFKPRN